MKLGPEHNGAVLTAKVGEPVTIRVPENPTTGYRWRLELDRDRIQVTLDQFEGPDQPRGAPGMRLFALLPTRPGIAAVRLVKERKWEGRPTDEFRVTLDVQQA